jgi:hypothetical protein
MSRTATKAADAFPFGEERIVLMFKNPFQAETFWR